MKSAYKKSSVAQYRFFCLVFCCFTSLAQAALPPDFQNEKDLADIIAYIKSDHEVLSDLRVIDLAELAVYYGDSCRIQFARKVVKREAGWVGPKEPIEFKAKDCVDDVAEIDEIPVPKDKVRGGVVVSVEADDIACYLQIKGDAGKVHDELASYDLCEDESLLNKPSEFIYQRTSVPAASCGENPECEDTEMVWLIAEIK